MALIVILFLTLAAAFPAPAASDVFEVGDVRIDVTAETTAKARDQALSQAERLAFARLLERLTLFEDRERLPVLSRQELAGLVSDFQVIEEKTSSVRYIGRLTYRFRPDAVRKLLRDYELPFAETESRPVLALPLFQGAGKPVLWGDPNPWRDAWLARPAAESLVPVILPPGDLADVGIITAEQAAAGDIPRLTAMAERHGAAGLLLPWASLRIDAGSGRASLDVSTFRIGSGGHEQSVVRSFVAQPGEDADALMLRAAIELTRSLELEWKLANRMQFGAMGVTAVRVPIAGLSDWLSLRKLLEGLPMVRQVEVVLLTREAAMTEIHHMGGVEQLATAMAQARLRLSEDGDGWVLVRSDR